MLPDIPQQVGGIYIMIAGVYIAIVFHHGYSSARFLKNAKGMFLVKSGAKCLFEMLDGDPSDIVLGPFVKDFNQKPAKSFCWYGGCRYPFRRIGRSLHQGQKGNVAGSQFSEKAVDFQRIHRVE